MVGTRRDNALADADVVNTENYEAALAYADYDTAVDRAGVERYTFAFYGNETQQFFRSAYGIANSHYDGFDYAGMPEEKGFFSTGDEFYVGCKTGYDIMPGHGEDEAVGSVNITNERDAQYATAPRGPYVTPATDRR